MSAHVVITGANRGIGLSFCQHYLAKGYEVTAVVRKASAELSALTVNVIEGVDVSVAADIDVLAQQLSGRKIDILINNAGIFHNETLADTDFDAIEKQLAINSLGPIRVTAALQNNLVQGAKVAMITSRMGSITDNTSGGYNGYGDSSWLELMG